MKGQRQDNPHTLYRAQEAKDAQSRPQLQADGGLHINKKHREEKMLNQQPCQNPTLLVQEKQLHEQLPHNQDEDVCEKTYIGLQELLISRIRALGTECKREKLYSLLEKFKYILHPDALNRIQQLQVPTKFVGTDLVHLFHVVTHLDFVITMKEVSDPAMIRWKLFEAALD
ncbi:hypothetical protein FGO68_gene980 [Halteria grandinella]|uniref:Uncharacterized protein n=1 Tax=Halteria grandinella TaxID=5974 RepID=A0A8J8NP02_HALGN|nr:hypothetical protein FGO68_gene980 [Halteria grandinella]